MGAERTEDSAPSQNSEESGQRRIDNGDESPDISVDTEEIEITIDPEGVSEDDLSTLKFEQDFEDTFSEKLQQQQEEEDKKEPSPVRLVNDTSAQADEVLRISSPELDVPSEDERPTLIPPPSQRPKTDIEEPDPEADTKPYKFEFAKQMRGFMQSDFAKDLEAAMTSYANKLNKYTKTRKGEPPKMPGFQKYFDAYLETVKKND